MLSFARDVLHALRDFGRRPGLPLVIVVSLGFAMGISTSLFSVVNSMWFAPWAVHGSDRVRVVSPGISSAEWRYWREHARSFSGLAAHREGLMRLDGRLMHGGFVSANYFQVLGVPMLVGQAFSRQDEVEGAAGNTVVISHHLWQTRFGGDAKIVGRPITLGQVNPRLRSVTLTVVGVAADGFEGPAQFRVHVWLPLSAARHFPPDGGIQDDALAPQLRVRAFGRLAPGMSGEQAEAELSVLRRQFEPEPPLSLASIAVRSTDRYSQSPPSPQTYLVWQSLLIGIVFITLIACANVANLLLARGHSRRGEIALRVALGASRGRIIRQLLTETFVLSIVAAALGVLIASWLPEAVLGGLMQSIGLTEMVRLAFPLDYRVLFWALALSTISCVAFGMAPALRSTEVGLGEVLKEAQGISKRALLPSLLSYQTIVSVMALAIAGLMLRSEPVIEARRVSRAVAGLTAVRPDMQQGLNATQRQTLLATIAAQLHTISGKQNVAGISAPVQPGINQSLKVTPEYFAVMRAPWHAGRPFAASDPIDRVLVVNEAFARRFWPGKDPIGRVVAPDTGVWDGSLIGRHVVGVVRDGQLSNSTAYLPALPEDQREFLVRGSRDRIAREMAPLLVTLRSSVTVEMLSGSSLVAATAGPTSFTAWITMAFGAVALFLGSIGFLSLLEYAVQQRTREIGIRRALGAEPRHVVRSLVEPAARPLIRGLFVGSVGSALAGVFMRRADLPAGVNPLDPMTYAGVVGVLAVAVALASYAPARRAIRIEPSKALRFE
jgi:putative ABC transport system permease protein